jgi:exopolysaccharide biosynthesis polyprenyl glycosylphosphotransferase
MFRRFSINFALFSMALDGILVALNLALADLIRPALSDLPFARYVPSWFHVPLLLYILLPIAWVMVLLLFSVYDGRRNLRLWEELSNLTLGSALASVVLAGMLYLSFRMVSRLLFLGFILTTYLSLLAWRLLARTVLRAEAGKWIRQRKVIIVGSGTVGKSLQEQIDAHPWLGLKVIGILTDDAGKHQDETRIILGTVNDARQVVSQHNVDDVVVALPDRAYQKINNLVVELHDLPVKVWLVPDYFRLALHKAVVEEFAGIAMLDLRAPALNEYQRMVKRAFDLVAGTLFQIFMLPIMTGIAIAIRLDSPGPALFKQIRVGENGRLFGMYKFRTMVQDAEQRLGEVLQHDENGNLIHKFPDDPRITRVGHFLRRTSLDEVPNIFNVLRGEMSLVGPRPELPMLVENYQPWQHKRFAVPQGMTGWWQINGRSDKPMHLHTEDDLYYVQHYSLWLDIKILIKTVWVWLRGRGAY